MFTQTDKLRAKNRVAKYIKFLQQDIPVLNASYFHHLEQMMQREEDTYAVASYEAPEVTWIPDHKYFKTAIKAAKTRLRILTDIYNENAISQEDHDLLMKISELKKDSYIKNYGKVEQPEEQKRMSPRAK